MFTKIMKTNLKQFILQKKEYLVNTHETCTENATIATTTKKKIRRACSHT